MLFKLLSNIGAWLASAAYAIGIRKDVTLDNLTRAFPERHDSEDIAKRSYHNLGRVFSEMLYLRFASRNSVAAHLRITNKSFVLSELKKDKGAILLSAHLANWEWMALATGIELNIPLAVIVKNQRSGFTERFLNTMRTRFGNLALPAGDVRAFYRVLQQGGIVAMLGDQAAPVESVFVPFFGREVPTFEGAARFALRTRAPLLLAECVRQSTGDYEMTFHSIPFDDLVEPSDANILELTKRHTALLERIIGKQPELWLWQHRRWKNARPIQQTAVSS